MSVVLQIPISDRLLVLLDQRARAVGVEREAYVLDTLAQHVTNPPEGLEAVQAEVVASGMTDDELQPFLEQVVAEVRAERIQKTA